MTLYFIAECIRVKFVQLRLVLGSSIKFWPFWSCISTHIGYKVGIYFMAKLYIKGKLVFIKTWYDKFESVCLIIWLIIYFYRTILWLCPHCNCHSKKEGTNYYTLWNLKTKKSLLKRSWQGCSIMPFLKCRNQTKQHRILPTKIWDVVWYWL